LRAFKARWGLEVYLEPGTAVALNAGALVAEVLDTGWNDGHFAVLDASATCHMPDVIEAPYTPDLLGGVPFGSPTDDAARDDHVFRLGGPTCLAGDVIGTYRLDRRPKSGDRLLFLDQAYYTMVKSTTFNGTQLPAIALWDSRTDALRVIREFGYGTFEGRLA
jgi:carboxynorspermidine decarboxylase